MILKLDLETRSRCNLRKAGSYRYATDPSTEITLFAYRIDDGLLKVWDLTVSKVMPADLAYAAVHATEIWAHNGIKFDRLVLRVKYPNFFGPYSKWVDIMVRAYQHALPGALGQLSDIFALDEAEHKKSSGKDLVRLFCKPNKKGVFNDRHSHPEEWAEFVDYAGVDIIAMEAIARKLPKWNLIPEEKEYLDMDTRMNDRGFMVDVDLAVKAEEALLNDKSVRDIRTFELTEGDIAAASQRDRLLKYIVEAHGVSLPDMKKATLERRLQDPDLPDVVKELIQLRLLSASTSGKKWRTLLDMVCPDGRLHGTLQYGAAFRTLRWGGRGFQPQNLTKPQGVFRKSFKDILYAIEAVKGGFLSVLYHDVVEAMSAALKSSIMAEPGKRFVIADLSSIEGRGIAYLAGETWKIKAYEAYDRGEGPDLYILTYARTFMVPIHEVDDAGRSIGKVLELMLGFGGGVGAFLTGAATYRIDLDAMANKVWDWLADWAKESAQKYYNAIVGKKSTYGLSEKTFIACDAIKRMWRSANPMIAKFWDNLESAVRKAVNCKVPVAVGKCVVDVKGKWMRIKLPSGRYLSYPGIQVGDEGITYLGMNIYSHRWCRLKTYGGKLSENITQAFCRDLFAHGVLRSEQHGYYPVLLVHDELVAETEDDDKFNAEDMCKHLCHVPEWAIGMPIAAKGFESKRYRKD